jgi:hypothetical protein
VVGDRDGLRLVLDDQHGVALVAQLQQQIVHPLDVVRVHADRRLVEDVGDVGQRRAEVADHLRALRLAAGERARRPVEGEVAEPDLLERVEQVVQPGEQRSDRRFVELLIQSRRSLICIAHSSAMLLPWILDDRASSLSRVPSHAGQVVNVTARSTNARMWGCIASTSLERNDFWIFGIRPSKVTLTPSTLILVGSL